MQTFRKEDPTILLMKEFRLENTSTKDLARKRNENEIVHMIDRMAAFVKTCARLQRNTGQGQDPEVGQGHNTESRMENQVCV